MALAMNADGKMVRQGSIDARSLLHALHGPSPLMAYDDVCATRNSLALRWFDHPEGARSLAIVSPRDLDGRAAFAASLAACFAEVGMTTLLIDADLRTPSQHGFFGLDRGRGLGEFLAAPTNPMPWHHVADDLTVLTAGSQEGDPQNLLLGPGLEALFHRARTEFQVVIADTPAAQVASDFQVVATQAIGALVTLSAGKTRTREALDLVNGCRTFGIRVVGSVTLGSG